MAVAVIGWVACGIVLAIVVWTMRKRDHAAQQPPEPPPAKSGEWDAETEARIFAIADAVGVRRPSLGEQLQPPRPAREADQRRAA